MANLEKFMKFVKDVNQGKENKIRNGRCTTKGDPK
ncbi:DUF4362 domain-containing protein [Paenisporosarcina sp. TG20]